MNQLYRIFQNFWTRDKSFTFLLIVLVVYMFVIIPFLKDNVFSKISFLLFYYLLLTSSMPFLLKRNKKMIAYLLFIFPFIFLVIEISFRPLWIQVLTDFFVVMYCITLGIIILIRTFEHGRVNNRRVQGAMVVYLLAGLVFCLIFHSIFILSSIHSFNGVVGSHRQEFLYFSFCTLTTAGYGDILPLTALARSLSNLESLIGILYPAVLIARLVSLEIYYKKPQP
jgi:hypothetical protein